MRDLHFSCDKSIGNGVYFLAVSTKPFDNRSFDKRNDKHCLIYVKEEDSVVFVKDKIIKPEDLEEEEFSRLIKYAAGMMQENDYEIVYGVIKKSNQGWKIHWMERAFTGHRIFCLVRPKNQE